ncbi:MAG: PQQ-binding-like beta-propeller repeat protein [Candidatus Coatesbacteria bacterium]
MESSLGFPRGRAVPVLVLAGLLIAFLPGRLVLAEGTAKRTVSAPGLSWNGWPTQDWPMGGQDGSQPRCIEEEFTSAQYSPSSGAPVPPMATLAWFGDWINNPGQPCDAAFNACDVLDQPAFSNFAVFPNDVPHQIVGEVATAACAGTAPVGPHGVAVALTKDGILAFASPAAWASYGAQRYFKQPGGLYDFVGTPVVVGSDKAETSGQNSTGSFTVYACANRDLYDSGSPAPHIISQQVNVSYAMTTNPGGGAPGKTLRLDGSSWRSHWWDSGQKVEYGPALSGGVLFLATRASSIDNWNPGSLYAVNPDDFSTIWAPVKFTIGPGASVPGPRGQEPPAANEWYGATTPVAVSGQLVVVGCAGASENGGGTKYALFAFNAQSGVLRWMVRVDAEIMPAPVIVGETIVFGTANGRAYAVNAASGSFRWQTGYGERLRYRTNPYNAPEEYADTILHGPAIDAAGTYAYFGGSDGGIARFDVASGIRISSGSILMHASLRSWGHEYDKNGRLILRPLTMNSAPVIFRNEGIVFKLNTLNYDVTENGSFLLSLAIPSLSTFRDAGVASSPVNMFYLAQAGVLYQGGSLVLFSALNGNSTLWTGLFNHDLIRQVDYIDNPGWGYSLNTYSDTADTGGLSMGSGFLFATDRGGHIAMIPAAAQYVYTPPGGSTGPYPVPHPGPADEFAPPLGPIVVYPNPFDPAKAVGHVAKFKNLPEGASVELFTLAYERVRKLFPVNHRADWDGTNEAGQPVATGIYLYKIFLPGNVPPMTGRLALIR